MVYLGVLEVFVNKPSLAPSPASWKDPLLSPDQGIVLPRAPQSAVLPHCFCTFYEEGKSFLHVLKKKNSQLPLGLEEFAV